MAQYYTKTQLNWLAAQQEHNDANPDALRALPAPFEVRPVIEGGEPILTQWGPALVSDGNYIALGPDGASFGITPEDLAANYVEQSDVNTPAV